MSDDSDYLAAYTKSSIPIALIVAMSRNRVIGNNNELPWHLPNDLKHFKSITMGKPIIMGRKTFESIGRPLPGRTNIVVSGSGDFYADGVLIAHSISEAVEKARKVAHTDNAPELVVIGGAQIYRELLPQVTRLYLTQVHAEVLGDAFFPEVDWTQWRQLDREDFGVDHSKSFAYSITTLLRDS